MCTYLQAAKLGKEMVLLSENNDIKVMKRNA